VPLRLARERLGDLVERVVPGDRLELAGPFRPDPPQRPAQTLRMMEALGIARDLGVSSGREAGTIRWR
jgi:hypothetical protein